MHRIFPTSISARKFGARALSVTAVALIVSLAAPLSATAAEAPIALGTASTFGVLSGSAVTNTGPSVISGDVGVSPGSAITGFPPGLAGGSLHTSDAVAKIAQDDLTTAYVDAAGRTATESGITELGGRSLTAGVYAGGALSLTGTLTLVGDASSVFVFQAASSIDFASNSNIVLSGELTACNVFWQSTSSATLGSYSDVVGTVMALTSITANTGADVDGRLLARNGAVTLDTNRITAPENCSAAAVPPVVTPPVVTPPVVAPPVVTGPVVTPPTVTPSVTAPPTAAPSVTAPPVTAPPANDDSTAGVSPSDTDDATPASIETLVVTGANAPLLIAVATLLIAAGLTVVITARRRSGHGTPTA